MLSYNELMRKQIVCTIYQLSRNHFKSVVRYQDYEYACDHRGLRRLSDAAENQNILDKMKTGFIMEEKP